MSVSIDLLGGAAAQAVKNRLSSRCAQQALLISSAVAAPTKWIG
jgi:hypothetical protein